MTECASRCCHAHLRETLLEGTRRADNLVLWEGHEWLPVDARVPVRGPCEPSARLDAHPWRLPSDDTSLDTLCN